jgi:hypothetical protein
VVEGCFKEVVKQVKSLVKEEVFHTLKATPLIIAFVVSNFIFLEHMLNKDGKGPMEVLKRKKLHQVMDKFITLFSFNVWNLITCFKHWPGNKGTFLTF